MKKREHRLKQAVRGAKDFLEIPPSIQIFTNKQAVVQGACGILEYAADRIRIRYAGSEDSYYGMGLTIGCVSSDRLLITARIERLEYS